MPSATAITVDHRRAAVELAEQLVCAPEVWRPLVRYLAHGRAYAPIALPAPVAADAWVITWAPGSGLPRHDHGGAAGALVVVEGELEEHLGRPATSGIGRHRLLRPGPVVPLAPDHVHEVRNVGAEPAVSLHVYAPGLRTMRFLADDPRDDVIVEDGAR